MVQGLCAYIVVGRWDREKNWFLFFIFQMEALTPVRRSFIVAEFVAILTVVAVWSVGCSLRPLSKRSIVVSSEEMLGCLTIIIFVLIFLDIFEYLWSSFLRLKQVCFATISKSPNLPHLFCLGCLWLPELSQLLLMLLHRSVCLLAISCGMDVNTAPGSKALRWGITFGSFLVAFIICWGHVNLRRGRRWRGPKIWLHFFALLRLFRCRNRVFVLMLIGFACWDN